MDKVLIDAYKAHGDLMDANLKKRLVLYQDMDRDAEYAYLVKSIALKDIFTFFEMHLWTHDPRKNMLDLYGWKNPQLPFCLFDFQKDAIAEYCDAIDGGRDVLTEKSRDMGVSWLVICVALWYWLQPTSGNDILIGSRKFDYVDKKGSIDTLLEKFRYNLYYLHPAFKPEGYDANRHDNVGNIQNPETGSFVRGEANNPNFATSGRYKFIIPDEFSKWEETDVQAWTSMGDSSPCRLPVSTPWGMGRKFAKLRFSGEIKVVRFHWTLHPIKSAGKWQDGERWRSPWYDYECERRKGNELVDIGQELDINYLSTGFPYFDNDLIQKLYKELEDRPPVVKRYEFVRHRTEDGDDYIELFQTDNGRIWIRDEAISGWEYRYSMSADVAEGLQHGDNSCMVVFDRVAGYDVVGFTGKIDTGTFSLLLLYFAGEYEDAYIAPENNSMGAAVIQVLKGVYERIYREQKFDQAVDLETVKLGWNTNKRTRAIMCDAFREAVGDGSHGVTDKDVFTECITFVNINGKPQAEPGNWDDRVVTQAIKWMLHDWLPKPCKIDVVKEKYKGLESFAGGKPVVTKKDKRSFWG